MFRKKQTPPTRQRQVLQRSSAPVFSYYSNRNPSQPAPGAVRQRPAQQEKRYRPQKVTWSQLVTYAPTLLATVMLLVCCLYTLTLSSRPRVQMSQVQGYAPTEEYKKGIQELLGKSVLNRSKLLIDTKRLEQEIREAYPELGDVSVTIPLATRRLVVDAAPARPSILLVGSGETLVVDDMGRAILTAREAPSSMKDNVPVLEDQSGIDLKLGSYVLPASAVKFVEKVHQQLTEAGLRPESYVLPAIPHELHVSLKGEKYYIKFDITGEGDLQAGSFRALHKYISNQSSAKPKQYVDVRISGRVFYK